MTFAINHSVTLERLETDDEDLLRISCRICDISATWAESVIPADMAIFVGSHIHDGEQMMLTFLDLLP